MSNPIEIPEDVADSYARHKNAVDAAPSDPVGSALLDEEVLGFAKRMEERFRTAQAIGAVYECTCEQMPCVCEGEGLLEEVWLR